MLSVGETAVLISHGDPIDFLNRRLYAGKDPKLTDLDKMPKVAKGQAVVVVIDPWGKVFTTYNMG